MCKLKILLGVSVILFSSLSSAVPITDYITTFDFDVTSITDGSGNAVTSSGVVTGAIANGTSNGIGWEISPTTYWMNRTVTDGSFNYGFLPNTTDSLHASGDYTITFDQTVDKLLVALSNDNLTDSINFQLTSTDSSGVTFDGTQVVLNGASGGWALFENINSLTITNVNNNNITDGYDLAFHAFTVNSVPEPSITVLMASGLIAFGVVRRKNRA